MPFSRVMFGLVALVVVSMGLAAAAFAGQADRRLSIEQDAPMAGPCNPNVQVCV